MNRTRKLLTALTVMLLSRPCSASEKVIGYYGFWSPGHGLKAEDIPGKLLTHAIYSFILVTPQGECGPDPEDKINESGEPATLLAFSKLKLKYPHLKLMLSVGGWGIQVNSRSSVKIKRAEKNWRALAWVT